ncbi:MAG: ParB/RepB/Spo0J family partition protein, partial [Gammaproteobacteria bacterium]|nr:ParB/RepB/Spo0J family partition protein [Gammaproteobacteria bacterium]
MKKKKPGLGALGIDVLLSTGGPAPPAGDASLRTLPVELIHRSPYQPRGQVSPEALEELADSIRRQGILQPVVVRRVEGEYQLIAGERRWRAAQQAGLLEIPAVIRDADDQEAAALALVENLQREDLNPLEEARAYSGLVEQFGLTHQEVGEAVGRSRAAVSNSLRLLSLPAGVQ